MDRQAILRKYCYVDATAATKSKEKHQKWVRIKLDEIEEKLLGPNDNYDCTTTIQRFAMPTHETDEDHFAPMFFDFDYHADKGQTYQDVMTDVRKLCNHMREQYGLSNLEMRTYYSGSRGAHVLISPWAMGITPHASLTHILKLVASELAQELELGTLDLDIYSCRRMFRVVNSLHPKTRRFKAEIPWPMWLGTPADIEAFASSPRPALYTEEQELEIPHNTRLHDWYCNSISLWEWFEDIEKQRPKTVHIRGTDYPVCIKCMLARDSLIVPGTGNAACLTLGTYLKDAGKTLQETLDILTPWVCNLKNVASTGQPAKAKASLKAVLNAVFDTKARYRFICNCMRALGTAETPVACDWGECKVVREGEQVPENHPLITLAQASHARYTQQRVKVPVILAGEMEACYTIPWTVRAECHQYQDCKHSCRLRGKKRGSGRGGLQETFSVNNPNTLRLIKCSLKARELVLREILCIHPTCKRCNLTIEANINITEVYLIPQVTETSDPYSPPQTEPGALPTLEVLDGDLARYTMKTCYMYGDHRECNQKYNVYAYPMADPWQQTTVFAASECERVVDDPKAFRFRPEYIPGLRTFQVRDGQSVLSKFLEIHQDFAVNVHKIWRRQLMGMAADLVYHSALNFRFLGDLVGRGWCEGLIIGDSGQGKSKMIKGLQQHYGLGAWVQGETSTRTGLVYALQKDGTGSRWTYIWGTVPLNDSGLVIVDEFSGIPADEFAQMSESRQTGIVKISRISKAETRARTRLLYLTNSREGWKLDQFNYGCEALVTLIPHREDIRRVDFAMAVSSGEIEAGLINMRPSESRVPHTYTAGLCNMLVKWVWSRKPEDIVIDATAEDMILAYASEMGREYSASIPLVEAADQRIKLARLSVAAAARVYSTDETGTKIVVRPEHVMFVKAFLDKVYRADNFGYWHYSQREKSLQELTPEQTKRVESELYSLHYWNDLREVLLSYNKVTVKHLEEALAKSNETAKEIMKTLIQLRLVRTAADSGYIKTPAFVKILRKATLDRDC